MARDSLHDEPFDEVTLAKLELFQLYVREWLPVWTAPPTPWKTEINIFDFFAGPGTDSNGVSGSPLRILQEIGSPDRIAEIRAKRLKVSATFSDINADKIAALRANIVKSGLASDAIRSIVAVGGFDEQFREALQRMQSANAANLLIIDQYGVKHVSDDVFQTLIELDQTDFLFFVSSSYLHRFRDHPAIKRYHDFERPEDYYQVHNVVLEHYRKLVSPGRKYWLAPFSLKKGSNVYGVIFGSAHPKGMEKFLRLAWKLDGVNGQANFPISREDFHAGQLTLDIVRPRKVEAFEADLREALVSGMLQSEAVIYTFCLERGMMPSHARPVIHSLRIEKRIEADFDVPSIESLREPRCFRLLC